MAAARSCSRRRRWGAAAVVARAKTSPSRGRRVVRTGPRSRVPPPSLVSTASPSEARRRARRRPSLARRRPGRPRRRRTRRLQREGDNGTRCRGQIVVPRRLSARAPSRRRRRSCLREGRRRRALPAAPRASISWRADGGAALGPPPLADEDVEAAALGARFSSGDALSRRRGRLPGADLITGTIPSDRTPMYRVRRRYRIKPIPATRDHRPQPSSACRSLIRAPCLSSARARLRRCAMPPQPRRRAAAERGCSSCRRTCWPRAVPAAARPRHRATKGATRS